MERILRLRGEGFSDPLGRILRLRRQVLFWFRVASSAQHRKVFRILDVRRAGVSLTRTNEKRLAS